MHFDYRVEESSAIAVVAEITGEVGEELIPPFVVARREKQRWFSPADAESRQTLKPTVFRLTGPAWPRR